MRRNEFNISARSRLALSVIVIVLSLVLVVGTAFARYQTDITGVLNYSAKAYAIFLCRGYDAANDAIIEGESSWVSSKGRNTLSFCVSNGKSRASYSADSQQIYIRLNAALSIEFGEGAEVSIIVPTGEGPAESYLGVATPIEDNTPLYNSFGAGWSFIFVDDTGEEVSWKLQGGDLSILSATVIVDGVELKDPMLMQIQVTGDNI